MKIHVVPSLFLLGVGVVLALLSLALFLRGVRERRRAAGFLDRAVATTGEVVAVDAKDVSLRAEPDTRYFPTVRFTVGEETFEAQSMTDCRLPPPRIGDTIEIVYDPQRPVVLDLAERAERTDGAGRTSFVMASLVLAVALSTPLAWLVLSLVVWTS